MNADLKEAFAQIKPICDMLMVNPTPENILAFSALACELKKESLQELQQYMLFPIITHLQSKEIGAKHELQRLLVNAMKEVLLRIQVSSFEMCVRVEMNLAKMAFDKNKPGMIADIPEELKLAIMQCLTALMLNLETPIRVKMIQSHAPLLAQAVFVSVHMAKMEKFRTLRLAALDSLMAHTCTHHKLTDNNYMISDPILEQAVVQMLCCILPGVLATLQDVAMCMNNPGHAVVVSSLNATHRILCMTMNNKYLKSAEGISVEDFVKVVQLKDKPKYVSKGKKDTPILSPEWFSMAGEKLEAVIRSLVRLVTHEHFKVREELALMCYRIISECNGTMQPSLAMCLDVLISLSSDSHPAVGGYCARARDDFFRSASADRALDAVEGLAKNLFMVLGSLPRVLNNIDSARKLSTLNLLHGYISVLCDDNKPQRLSTVLANGGHSKLADSLLAAAALDTDLALLRQHATRDLTAEPPIDSPWCKFRHLDSPECEVRFRDICMSLGEAGCAQLLMDKLLESFRESRAPELLYLMNWIAASPKSPVAIAERLISTYTEEAIWSVPLHVTHAQTDSSLEHVGLSSWSKDNVPGLFEGAVETRYSDISYQTPRLRQTDPHACKTLREAQHNMLRCCLLTEGIGVFARRLGRRFQTYMLKTLCLILERVGSRYEMLHLAGVKALHDIRTASGFNHVQELVAQNADYVTHQLTTRLKKAWDIQSALEILSVVMEYSDSSILDYLLGIVDDVLVQSCDKYYQRNLYSYLRVFHTFVSCIHKWFPTQENRTEIDKEDEIDILQDVFEFIKNEREANRLFNEAERDEYNKTAEDMFKEDLQRREEGALDYDDKVTEESPPLPRHIEVTKTILKRCINFIPTKNRDDAILAIQVINLGLPVLKDYEDELLPLVHLTWAPLVTKFEDEDSAVMRSSLDLLVTLAELSKDFITHRTVKDVLPRIYAQLGRLSSRRTYRTDPQYILQVRAINALPVLVVRLKLPVQELSKALHVVRTYLSVKQPAELQTLAVQFFKRMLQYNYGVVWLHLRQLCANDITLEPPNKSILSLGNITGTPYECTNKEYNKNVKAIFYE